MIITLTGRPCSGKSTVASILKDKYNFRIIKVGDIFKEEAKKRNMNSEEFSKLRLNDPTFDYQIDNATVELGKKYARNKVLFDSRLAWHFIPNSFKVYMDLSDDEITKRLVNSDRVGLEKYSDPKKAKKALLDRERNDRANYIKIYNVDISDLSNYDLVISNENCTPEETADIIYAKYLEFKSSKKQLSK